ncbi:MAG: hypothetical protein GEU96_15780 [Propionibacteriales bacterium]|nr:hypothetical protein [Propionibacteriales bacterium]
MPMDEAGVVRWVEAYRRAWTSNDPVEIGALYSEDAQYYMRPYREPVIGRDAIVADWLERRDDPGDTTFRFEVVSACGPVGVVKGATSYLAEGLDLVNLWVLRFDAEGRATEFTEWWMEVD